MVHRTNLRIAVNLADTPTEVPLPGASYILLAFGTPALHPNAVHLPPHSVAIILAD